MDGRFIAFLIKQKALLTFLVDGGQRSAAVKETTCSIIILIIVIVIFDLFLVARRQLLS